MAGHGGLVWALFTLLSIATGVNANTVYRGYTFSGTSHGSDAIVTAGSYLNITYDVCGMEAAARADDYIGASLIYATGKFSRRGTSGFRIPRSSALRNYSPETWYVQYAAFYKTPQFLENFIVPALQGLKPYTGCPDCIQTRREAVSVYALFYAYMVCMHEMDSAGVGMANLTSTSRALSMTEVGDSIATYFGPKNDTKCSMWSKAANLGKEFCTPNTNARVVQAYIRLLATAKSGTYAQWKAQRAVTLARMDNVFLQLTLSYAKRVQTASSCLARSYQAGALAAFRAVAPRLAATAAGPVSEILKLFDPSRKIPTGITSKVIQQLRAAVGDAVFRSEISNCK